MLRSILRLLWGYERSRFGSAQKMREILTMIARKDSGSTAAESGMKHCNLYSRTAADEEWV